jgi:hypothetical protein
VAAEDVLGLLKAIDAELYQHAGKGETLDLYLLGRSALILAYGLRIMTKDVDVVLDTSQLLMLAVRTFGKDGTGHRGQGLYLETVSSGFPPIPGGFQDRCIGIPGNWLVIRPKRPEPHDLIVTKLQRFHAGDREDIQIVCDNEEVAIEVLRERFESAHAWSDRDDPKFEKAAANWKKSRSIWKVGGEYSEAHILIARHPRREA